MSRKELNTSDIELYNNLFDISERKIIISNTLATLRKSFELTQTEVAKYIGIKAGTYSTYENGTREAPAEIIVRLALLYNVPTDAILQTQRFSKENFIRREQFDNLDKELDELSKIISEKELNPEAREFFKTFTNSLGELNNHLSEFVSKLKLEEPTDNK